MNEKKVYFCQISILQLFINSHKINMPRLFIAFEFIPTKDLLAFYSGICSSFSKLDRFNLIKPELMHVTLKFIGETDKNNIKPIVQGIQNAVQGISAFEVKTEKIGIFGSRYQPQIGRAHV